MKFVSSRLARCSRSSVRFLTAAYTTEVQAMADYNKILAQLAFAEATILERNRISVALATSAHLRDN